MKSLHTQIQAPMFFKGNLGQFGETKVSHNKKK